MRVVVDNGIVDDGFVDNGFVDNGFVDNATYMEFRSQCTDLSLITAYTGAIGV